MAACRRRRPACGAGGGEPARRPGHAGVYLAQADGRGGLDKERQLKLSVDISNAVTSVVADLGIQPAFIVAKGGITSSDIGVRALRVRRALVMGQIAPGVPVWRTDGESKFPYMPYVIFPGNVGDRTTLLQVVRRLRGE